MSGGRRASESFVGDRHFEITPSDTVNFTDPDTGDPIDACVAVLSAGTVMVVDMSGDVIAWIVAAVPFVIPVKARRVNASGTTGGIKLVGVW